MRRLLLIASAASVALAGCQPPSGDQKAAPAPASPQASAPQAPAALTAVEAFRMAFGTAPPARRKPGNEAGDDFTYSPGKIVPVAPGLVALVSTAVNASDCHACSGALAVHYFKNEGGRWALAGSWPEFTHGNGFGAPPDWSVRPDLAPGVWLASEAGWSGQGYTCGSVDLIELTPQGPAMRGDNIPTHYDNAGTVAAETDAQTQDGTLSRLADGKFRVTVTGSRSGTVDYEMVGTSLARRGPNVITEC